MQHILFIIISLALSIIFFILGLVYPILSTKQSLFGIGLKFQEVRLFDSVKMFFNSGDYLLSGIIFLFTIILPIVKFVELINRVFEFTKFSKRTTEILHALDKWSMLDVFLVALLLLNFKMDSNIIVMELKIGTNFIALAVILRMLSSHLIDLFKNHKTTRL
jgi:uncharacterized paraquat-inducible protein A